MAGDNRGSKVSLYFLKAECNTSWTMSKVISKRISVHGTTQYVLTHLPRELRFSYATVYRFTLQASLVCKKNSELPTNWKKKKDKKVSLLNELGDEKEETFDVWKETQFFDINIIFSHFGMTNDNTGEMQVKKCRFIFFNSCVTCMNWHVVSANYSSLSGNVVAKHQLNMLILQTFL